MDLIPKEQPKKNAPQRIPGVPGTVRPAEVDTDAFETARRTENKRLSSSLSFKNPDSAGPSPEQLAHFTQHRLMKSSVVDVKPGEERSVLHFRPHYAGHSFMDLPDDASDCYRYPPETPEELRCELPRQCSNTLLGHAKGITAVHFNPVRGHLLLSGSLDCRVKVWNVVNGQCVRTFIGHDRPIRQAFFEPHDGLLFLLLGTDRCVKLWDVESGQCQLTLEQKRTPTCACFAAKHQLLVGNADGRIQLWDLRQKTMAREYWHHTDSISTLTLPASHDPSIFMSTSEDRSVRVWETLESVPRSVLGKPDVCQIYAAAVKHPLSDAILCSALSSELSIFQFDRADFALRRRPKQLVGHKAAGAVVRPAFSADGRFVAAGDGTGSLCMWDWVSAQSARCIEGAHEQAISDCAFSPVDPRLLATGSLDASIKLWN